MKTTTWGNTLCSNSKWKYVVNPNLRENLSDIRLFNTERLKFATGIHKGDRVDILVKNHNENDSDFTKGFIEGIIITHYKKKTTKIH